MKKSLMATVAAVALIAGASMASAAEGAKEQSGMKAGAAVKAEPEMKKGAPIKAGAETKGRAETTGAGVESKTEMKSEPTAHGKTDAKSGPSPDSNEVKHDIGPKSENDTKAKTSSQASEQKAAPAAKSSTEKSAADEKATPAAKSNAAAADSKASTSASTTLTTEQKSKIRTSVLQSSNAPKVSRSSINFNISVGTVVPRSGVRFVTVPDTIIEIHPQWRGYSYFIVDEEIIIIEPSSYKIVAILNV